MVGVPLRWGFVKKRTGMNLRRLDAVWSDLNQGANSLTAGRSHIIKTSLDLRAERHF